MHFHRSVSACKPLQTFQPNANELRTTHSQLSKHKLWSWLDSLVWNFYVNRVNRAGSGLKSLLTELHVCIIMWLGAPVLQWRPSIAGSTAMAMVKWFEEVAMRYIINGREFFLDFNWWTFKCVLKDFSFF